ncbi:MAG: suppressor of fused domain protein [Psychrobacillus sp.]
MNLEQYKKRAVEQGDWSPGWEAIDRVFEELYPNQEPAHFGTDLNARAWLGGDQYIDGYSIYESPHGYKHMVTYGMTDLYVNEQAFGGEWSGWGYEMTIKLPEGNVEDCLWAVSMLSNLARYTYTQKKPFEPFQYVAGNGSSLHIGEDSAITALLVLNDPEVSGVDSVHGRIDFLQMVGITQRELELLIEDSSNVVLLSERMKKDNPYFITDMKRTKSYI